MTRKELAAVLIEKAGFEAAKIPESVNQVFETMKESLERGGENRNPGLRRFQCAQAGGKERKEPQDR